MSSSLEHIIDCAKAEARKSPVLKSKHGAVVVSKRGIILAKGYNRNVLSCASRKRLSIHAEVDALSQCSPKDLKGATLVVIRLSPLLEGTTGRLGTSRPCESCQRYIERRGIERVLYSDG